MSLKLNSSGGGSVTLQEPVTASTLTFTLPAFSGTAATLASVTNNGVLFVNGSGQPTSGSALTFDGTNLGLNVTPSAWVSGNRFIDINASASYGAFGSSDSMMLANAYWNGSNWIRKNANNAWRMVMESASGAPAWTFQYAGNSTSGSTISWSEAMRIDSSGNVGIGTSSPARRLDVLHDVQYQFRIGTAAGNSYDIGRSPVDGLLHFYGNQNGFTGYVFGGVNGERARIDSSGNLLVGTPSAGAGNSRVYINGDGTNPAFRALANTSTTSVYAGIFRHESTTAGAYIQFVTDTNVETGRIYDSAGTMQYASSSDARLKTNVQPLQNGLSSVLAMNPCTYDMRRGETTTIPSAGLIAQEVFEVYPYAVGVGGDDENVNPWSVDYGKLTPLLIKAIQEQQAMIAQLQADIASLKGTA